LGESDRNASYNQFGKVQTYVASLRVWETVCKTVRCMLSDRWPVCLSALSVTLVHCGQTVGWIQMKLGTQIGLGRGHIVLDGDPASLPKRGGGAPHFQPMSIVAKRLNGSR